MKRIVLVFAAIAMSFVATAQNERPTNWFLGASGGFNTGFDGKEYLSRIESHSGNGTAFDVYVGKFFNNTLGFRAGYQGLSVSDQYIEYGKLNYSYAHADLLLRCWDFLVPYIHAGAAKVENLKPAGGVGIMVPIKLSNRVSFIPDLKATAFPGSTFPEGDGFGRNLTATLGLRVNLGKVGAKPEPEVIPEPIPVIVPKPEPAPEPEPEPVVEEPKPTVQEAVEEINKSFRADALFDFDKSEIRADAIPILDKAVAWLNEFPTVKGVIEGHTDSRGTEEYNQGLSERRAKAVYDYLVNKGINKFRLTWKGFGESRPVATNETDEGRQLNRRIVLVLDEE
ncbi:MAG: OmpA family protein [Bacteroidales bacterium]|nr:OmpA family protein [Bacteroidales bacterium]